MTYSMARFAAYDKIKEAMHVGEYTMCELASVGGGKEGP